MKPMLAGKVDLNKLSYPVFTSPKLDGIRCLIVNGQAVSRALEPIPNQHVQSILSQFPNGLDGELMCGSNFSDVDSGIMSKDGEPDFTYHIFDFWQSDRPFCERTRLLEPFRHQEHIEIVYNSYAHKQSEVLQARDRAIEDGHEGLMVRDPNGYYKYGRSTTKEGFLLKLKQFEDSEGEIIGFIELEHNDNVLEKDNLGRAKRSSHRDGKRLGGVLGAFILKDPNFELEFKVGSGFSAMQRLDFWNRRHSLLGRLVKYQYQPHGIKDRPRHPVFLGFRDRRDM